MIEIERKYLVSSEEFKNECRSRTLIKQGFLNTDPNRVVRIRQHGEVGYLTVKGRSNDSGTTRQEWEWEIALNDAIALLQICEPGIIEKVRYEVVFEDQKFEIDEFRGANEGLILAEIELRSEEEVIIKPNWLGVEVTGDIRYYNSNLSKNPYKNWQYES